jgi:hypothetical protein
VLHCWPIGDLARVTPAADQGSSTFLLRPSVCASLDHVGLVGAAIYRGTSASNDSFVIHWQV